MTSQLVLQRIRNRIIETLEHIVAGEHKVPDYGFDELVNDWDDYARLELLNDEFASPVYTATEVDLIRGVTMAVDAMCSVTPQSISNDDATLALPEWKQVVATTQAALNEMLKRGKLSEDLEI